MYGKYRMNNYFAADNPLLPGCMFTIEPGIYIPEKNLGIRIEDDILVTEIGHEILTKNAPKEIDEIEDLMKEKLIHIKENRDKS
jgi:Xaa-Pro aminopeptidase